MNPAACDGKRSFRDWSTARRRADRIERREGIRIAVYRCSACGDYHLGSKNEVFRARTCDFKRRKAELAMEEME